MYEGGVRSTAFMSGPMVPTQARGTRFKGLLHAVDLTAAMLSMARVLPLEREVLNIDGISFLHNIFGLGEPHAGRFVVPINIIQGGQSYSAVRFGQYKVVFDHSGDNVRPAQGWYDENGDLREAPDLANENPIRVYDVENDPQERIDLSEQKPWLITYGHDLIQSYILGGRYHEPQEAWVHPDGLPPLHHGVWKPFMSRRKWERELQRQWGLKDDEDEALEEEENDVDDEKAWATKA